MTAEVLDKFVWLITAALGLVAAKFVYAVIVTLIVIFATISVSRAAERAKRLEEERGLFGRSRD